MPKHRQYYISRTKLRRIRENKECIDNIRKNIYKRSFYDIFCSPEIRRYLVFNPLNNINFASKYIYAKRKSIYNSCMLYLLNDAIIWNYSASIYIMKEMNNKFINIKNDVLLYFTPKYNKNTVYLVKLFSKLYIQNYRGYTVLFKNYIEEYYYDNLPNTIDECLSSFTLILQTLI